MTTNPRPTASRRLALGFTLFLLAASFGLPARLGAQTTSQALRELEARQRVEKLQQAQQLEASRQLEEQLARVREELARFQEMDQAKQEQVRAELLAQREGLERSLAAASEMDQERNREAEARVRELRERLRQTAVERERISRQTGEQLRRQLQEVRVQAEQGARRMQQVVVRLRARVRLGVSLDATQGADYDGQGAWLQSVMEDSPAEEAGLLAGDIITHLGGTSLTAPIPGEDEEDFDPDQSLPVQRLIALAGDLEDGEAVEVRYLRDDQSNTVEIVARDMDEPMVWVSPGDLEDRGGTFRIRPGEEGVWEFRGPDEEAFNLQLRTLPALRELDSLRVTMPEYRFFSPGEQGMRGMVFRGGEGPSTFSIFGRSKGFGLDLAELNPALGEYFSADRGVLVLDVDEDSFTGLLPGDVILSIDGRWVEDESDVTRILGSYEAGETVTFSLMRKGLETTVEGSVR